MKTNTKERSFFKRLLVSILLISITFGLKSQDLHVNNDDGSTSEYSITDVRRLTIEEPNLVVLLFNGDSFTFPLESLTNYQYKGDGSLQVDESFSLINDWKINIYPNPVSEQFTLSFSLKEAQKINYKITDLNGKLIAEKDLGIQTKGDHKVSIRTDEFSKGTYLIKVDRDGMIYTKKIVKN